MSRNLSSVRRSSIAGAFVLASGLARLAAAQTAPPDEIVLWTSRVGDGDAHGDWRRISDSSAAGGFALHNPDLGRSRVAPALASPTNYFEIAFTAKGATAYHLWIRMRAQNNSTANDSVHVQFSDSVTASGSSTARIGTTSSLETLLQDGSPGAAAPQGWGWTDNGWGSPGTPVYFAADGTHVVRIQQREDGVTIDQIVLSAVRYSSTPPGSRRNDTRILSATGGGSTAPSTSTIVIRPATAAAGRMFGSWQVVADYTAAGGQAVRNPNAGAASISPALSNPATYFETSFTATAGRAYHVWLRMRADGNSASNDSVHLQFSGSVTGSGSPTARIGTTSSLQAILQDGSPGAAAPQGWGWTDNGWGRLGSHIYFATTGTHTIRVQQREDGATIDQIIISPDTYLTSSPGWRREDQTVIPQRQTTSTNLPPTVSLTAPASGATFTAPATIALAATASDPENRLARVDFRAGATLVGSDMSTPYTFQWSSVPAGSYTLTAVAHDSGGRSTTSSPVLVTVNAPPAPFPTGWQHQDIGSPTVAGNATYTNGTFTVSGAGIDIYNTSDQFHFAYRQMTGDVEIVARVASLHGSNQWSKAGVMVRESLAANSRHSFAHFTVGNGYRLLRRTVTGGTSAGAGCAAGTTPGWVRLRRTGNTFEMGYSADRQTWASCGSVPITMAATVYVGLAVSNVDATRTATGVFDNVAVSQGAANQPPTVSLTAPAGGATFTAPATIALSATASDPEGRLAKVDFYSGSTLLASDTSSPFSFSWSGVPAGTYQLRAVATDAQGASASSATATVTVSTTSTSTSTKRVAFTASVDHATVTRYLLEVFPSTANTATATAIASSDLGKPTPSSSNEIIVDRTTFLNGLAPGSYRITVASVGSGGSSRSAPITFTR